MPSSKSFFEFVSEQLSDLHDVSYRAMMGEYIIYYRGKVVGGIYDDRLLLKPTKNAVAMTADAIMAIPYDKGKPMLLVEDLENREYLYAMIQAVYDELK